LLTSHAAQVVADSISDQMSLARSLFSTAAAWDNDPATASAYNAEENFMLGFREQESKRKRGKRRRSEVEQR